MIIKPECDVETVEDFAKYYHNSYMESRDGRILLVEGTHGSNLVLRDMDLRDQEGEGYVLLPWKRLQKELVYGRPPSRLVVVNDKLIYVFLQNTRVAGRGFSSGYYQYTNIAVAKTVKWQAFTAYEYTLAKAMLRPVYTPLDQALLTWLPAALSDKYGVLPAELGHRHLFCRDRCVGSFRDGKLVLYHDYKYIGDAMKKLFGFKGEVTHEAA